MKVLHFILVQGLERGRFHSRRGVQRSCSTINECRVLINTDKYFILYDQYTSSILKVSMKGGLWDPNYRALGRENLHDCMKGQSRGMTDLLSFHFFLATQ